MHLAPNKFHMIPPSAFVQTAAVLIDNGKLCAFENPERYSKASLLLDDSACASCSRLRKAAQGVKNQVINKRVS